MDLVSYYVTEEEKGRITDVIHKLMAVTKLDLVVVGDEGGRLIAYLPQGSLEDEEIAERFCVISASVIGALDNLDNLVQMRTNFLTEGIDSSLYIKMSEHKFFVATRFGKNVPVGTVRLFVEKAVKELDVIFENIRRRGKANTKLDFKIDDLML